MLVAHPQTRVFSARNDHELSNNPDRQLLFQSAVLPNNTNAHAHSAEFGLFSPQNHVYTVFPKAAAAVILAMGSMEATQIRILIADDHQLVRSGLRALLEREGEFKVVAEASDGYQAIELAALHKPDIVLLDVGMPRLNGTDAAQRISEKLPAARVIILSMHSDEAYVMKALKAGARGYLLKASPEADVLAAVRAVAAGNAYFSPSITKLLVEDYVGELRRRGVEDSYDLLSLREKEILQLLATGKTNRAIAEMLNISITTAESHRSNILQKLHLHSLAELILYAVRKGLICA